MTKVKATLKIDARPGAKRFQGVWLVRADGSRLLIDYRSSELWRAFENQQVVASGASYQPRGQAIRAAHFRVHTMQMANSQSTAAFVSMGPVTKFDGAFAVIVGKPGTKLAGEKRTEFTVTGGTTYQVANSKMAAAGAATVEARVVKRSPFVAHIGGPTIWLLDVDTQP